MLASYLVLVPVPDPSVAQVAVVAREAVPVEAYPIA